MKIRLDLTETQAKILKAALHGERYELAKMIKDLSPSRDYLMQKEFIHRSEEIDKMIDLIDEPYLV